MTAIFRRKHINAMIGRCRAETERPPAILLLLTGSQHRCWSSLRWRRRSGGNSL